MTLVEVAHSIRLEDMGQYVLTIILVDTIYQSINISFIRIRKCFDDYRDYLMMRIERTCA